MAKNTENKKSASKKKGAGITVGEQVKGPRPRLQIVYEKEVGPALMEELGLKNAMRIPRLTKIVINAGLGRATQNIKVIDQAVRDIGNITGQRPVTAKSKQAISNFKLRAGLPIGVHVTLRRENMWEFFDRLVSFALPRIRDFRGIHDGGFDGNGNFTMGLKDHLVFPEVDFESAEATIGMNITIVTTAKTNAEARLLLEKLGFPFKKRGSSKKAA